MELNNPKVIAESFICLRRLELGYSDYVAYFLYSIGSVDSNINDGKLMFFAFNEIRVGDTRYFLNKKARKNRPYKTRGLATITLQILEEVESLEHYLSYSFTELMLSMHNVYTKINGSSWR